MQDLFQRIGRKQWLRTSAYTGSASSNVNGSTVSSIVKDSKNSKDTLTVALTRIQGLVKEIGNMRFLIIDEVSMISCHMLSKLDARLKQAADTANKSKPFAGVHVVFFGDFIQYPCVAGTNLYEPLGDPQPVPDDDEDADKDDDNESEEKDDPSSHFDINFPLLG